MVVCGKFGAGVVAFDPWLWRKSWFVGFEEAICSGYEGVKTWLFAVSRSECFGFFGECIV